MFDKLQAVEARYEKLMSLISDPAVQADPATYRTHTKALSDIQETVETSTRASSTRNTRPRSSPPIPTWRTSRARS